MFFKITPDQMKCPVISIISLKERIIRGRPAK